MNAVNQELLGTLEIRVLAVQRTRAGRWWNFQHVISPFARLWLVLDGRATVRHHGRKFRLKPGHLHLVPPFTVHDCACSRKFDHYHLHIACRLPTGIDLLSLLDPKFELPAPRAALGMFRRLEQLYPNRKLPCFDPSREEYRRQSLNADERIEDVPAADWFEASGILRLLLAPFLRTAREHEGLHARATRQFLVVQKFIQTNLHKPLQLRELARAAELHPTYFSDRFHELVGVRPLEYLTRRRMERAQFLLLASRASVKQIANEVGMGDPSYFARAFARFSGCSPTAYRAAHGG
jgi:AraC-like DNA-binding protein